MNSWEEAYKNGFEINSMHPSVVVKDALDLIIEGSDILDIGCGNGRNTIYFANEGFNVDAVDIVNLKPFEDLSPFQKKRINFYHKDIKDLKIKKEKYGAIILARLVQYLDKNSLNLLIKSCSYGLKSGGLILLSYTSVSGTKFREKYHVKRYDYMIKDIQKIIERNGLKLISIKDGSTVSKHVPYEDTINTYDLIVIKE
ncbi:MAG: methyltransferase domain-containing protein [archaeon]